MKIFMYPEYVLSLFAARKLNRPVKWTSDRSEAFLSDDHGRDNVSHADLALDTDGKFLAMRVSTVANLGVSLQLRPLHPDRCRHRDAGRRLYDSGDPHPGQGRLHQHQPGGRLSRSRTAGSGLSSGTACRCGGARTEHAPRRTAPPQLHPAGSDALLDLARPDLRHRRVRPEHGRRSGPVGMGQLRAAPQAQSPRQGQAARHRHVHPSKPALAAGRNRRPSRWTAPAR